MTKPQKRGDRLNQSDRPHNNNLHNIPVPCSKENPCKICGASSHPCYWLIDESWCDSIKDPPSGWRKVGTTRSNQTRYQPITLEPGVDRKLNTNQVPNQLIEALSNPEINKEEREVLLTEVVSFVRSQQEFPSSKNLVPHLLSTAFSLLAERLNIPEIVFVAFLLPIAASLLPVGTQIEIDPLTNFQVSPILWVGLVGESGSTKSVPYRILLAPLGKIQTESNQRYQAISELYKADLENWEKTPKEDRGIKPESPVRREYYFQDATIESVADVLSMQPDRGIVEAIDELLGWFNGLNQYRRGQGNDRQKWLSSYDGDAIKVNRKNSAPIHIPQTAISLLGTIQPCVLRKQMSSGDDVDGLWARFWWVSLPLTKMPPPGEGPSCNIHELLYEVYKQLESFRPTTYRLDSDGRKAWRDWHIWCEKEKMDEPHSALRAIYPKAKERVARIALILHCLYAASEEHPPSEIISKSIIEASINLVSWSIKQAQIIYADLGAANHQDSARIARFLIRFAGRGQVGARDISRWYPAKPQLLASQAQEFMRFVESLCLAVGNGQQGSKYKITVPHPDFPDKLAEAPIKSDIKPPDNKPDSQQTIPDQQTVSNAFAQSSVSLSQEPVSKPVRLTELAQEKDSSCFVSKNSVADRDRNSETSNCDKAPVLPTNLKMQDTSSCVQVGDRVGKRLNRGWRGQVIALEKDHADVHWHNDPYPVLVPISELEVVEP